MSHILNDLFHFHRGKYLDNWRCQAWRIISAQIRHHPEWMSGGFLV